MRNYDATIPRTHRLHMEVRAFGEGAGRSKGGGRGITSPGWLAIVVYSGPKVALGLQLKLKLKASTLPPHQSSAAYESSHNDTSTSQRITGAGR